ncbi:MAG TPA: PilZ domain-containing protein [Vicinamibacterales bacterium]|jgi:PilZ domain-containing protein|nr:PilZ domain-containing protein [Vicinamibacterales bacterium]
MIHDSGSPAVLMREHLMTIVDVCRSGCLIESRQRLEVGTVGRLRFRLGDEECTDDVEVVRCDAVGLGQPLYHIGMRFLWTTPRQVGTIREAVMRHVEDVTAARTSWLM